MTKALVIIEVDIDTANFPVQEGLGENSNPQHPPMRAIAEGKRARGTIRKDSPRRMRLQGQAAGPARSTDSQRSS